MKTPTQPGTTCCAIEASRANRIFIYGHSLGGAIAAELANRHQEAAGLITESAFTSVLEMSKRRYGGLLRLLPMKYLVNQRLNTMQKISRLRVPLLLIHGKLDAKVPYQMCQQLYEVAPVPKQMLLIEGGEHANNGSVGWVEYRKHLQRFVDAHFTR